MVLNIVLLFCTMYYEGVFSALKITKSKYQSAMKNTEWVIHPAVSKFSQDLTLR